MRILFLCVLLVNIVFFLWQYRKGAPDVYLPPSYENSLGSSKYAQKIMLLSEINSTKELPGGADTSKVLSQQSVAPSRIDVGNKSLLREVKPHSIVHYTTKSHSVEQINSELITGKNLKPDSLKVENSQSASDEPLISKHNTMSGLSFSSLACYQLKAGEYTQATLTKDMAGQAYKLELFEQQQRDADSYLVLTLAVNSSEDAESKEQGMRQQGVDDLWLFREGVFKWRISLGLFSGKEQAEKAKEIFSEQTNQLLEVVPSYLKTIVTSVKISAHDEQGMLTFEQEFSDIIDQKVGCDEGKF